MKIKYILYFCTGILLLWGVVVATISAHDPTIYAPYAFNVAIPFMLLYDILSDNFIFLIALCTLPIPLLFSIWCFPLLKGQLQIPMRTKIFTLILILCSFVFLVMGWPYGIKYQGILHTIVMYLYNLVFWIALLFLYRLNKIRFSYETNFLFHWVYSLGWDVHFPMAWRNNIKTHNPYKASACQ